MNREPDRQRPPHADCFGAKALAATAALEQFRGQSAAWYRYMLGHKAFTLLVGDRRGQGNVLLHFVGCRHIAGPVTWILQQPIVRWHCGDDWRVFSEWRFEMRDDPAGFCISATALHWARDQSVAGYDETAIEIERAERERINYGLAKRSEDGTRR